MEKGDLRKKRVFLASLALVVFLSASQKAGSQETPVLNSSGFVLDNPNLSRKVSLALNDTNIVDAIAYLGEKADINVAIAKTVQGRATLSFKNVSIRDALDILFLANDLACEKRGEILYVLPAKDYEDLHGEKWSEARQVRLFKLQYSKPADVLKVLDTLKSKVGNVVVDNDSGTVVVMDTPEKIQQMKEAISSVDRQSLTQVFELKYAVAKEVEANLISRLDVKGVGSIKADERSNRLIVTALPGKMDEIEKIIQQLDQKLRQVLIEAKIISVTLTPSTSMGINWEALIQQSRILKSFAPVDITMNFPVDPAAVTTNFGKVTVGSLTSKDYTAAITLLKTYGDTKILSSPRITALSGQEAKMLVGTREAFITQTTSQSTGGNVTASSINFIDVGVQLKVTPIINKDGFVIMKIKPEVSRVDHTITDLAGDVIPIVDTTNAETSVMVKDGYTIIIGGLIKDSNVRTTKKFPGLGDLPLIGMAFKSKQEDVVKTEVAVFLTPHIIDADKNLTQWENKQTKPMRGYDDNA